MPNFLRRSSSRVRRAGARSACPVVGQHPGAAADAGAHQPERGAIDSFASISREMAKISPQLRRRCESIASGVRCLKSAVFNFSVMSALTRSLLLRREETSPTTATAFFPVSQNREFILECGLVGNRLGAAIGPHGAIVDARASRHNRRPRRRIASSGRFRRRAADRRWCESRAATPFLGRRPTPKMNPTGCPQHGRASSCRARQSRRLVHVGGDLGQELVAGQPDRHVIADVALDLFGRSAPALSQGSCRARAEVPLRSRNASSIDSGSTSGVSACMAWRTSRPNPDILRMSGRITIAWGTAPALNIGIASARRTSGECSSRGDHAALAAADDDRLSAISGLSRSRPSHRTHRNRYAPASARAAPW